VKGFAHWVSDRLIEQLLFTRLVDAATHGFYRAARLLQKLQVGLVRVYLAYVLFGAALLIYIMMH
jgi:hypothetical protein